MALTKPIAGPTREPRVLPNLQSYIYYVLSTCSLQRQLLQILFQSEIVYRSFRGNIQARLIGYRIKHCAIYASLFDRYKTT